MIAQTPFQLIADRLDLKAALTRGSASNDLLLPRAEDKVRGEVGNRFVDALAMDVKRGRYDPQQGYTVRVPKSFFSTRPASLLSLDDRVMYECLVSLLRPRIELHLLSQDIVFWPRGIRSDKLWPQFESSALRGSGGYVVASDISGFYESVDHRRLGERLVRATGKRLEVEALLEFLGRTMGAERGLPQGLEPSDPLATVYLAGLDFAMVRAGFAYTRHGDDIRISAATFDQARSAVLMIETQARNAGLLLNSHKTRILKAMTYELGLRSVEEAMTDTRSQLLSSKLKKIESDEEELVEAITSTGMDHLGWEFFYHGMISLTEVIEELRPALEPSDIEVAASVFADTWSRRPGSSQELSSDVFHQRLVASLVRLAAGRSTAALGASGDILTGYPDKTEIVASYLMAVTDIEPEQVAEQAGKVISGNRYYTEWEAAWALRVLSGVSAHVRSDALLEVEKIIDFPFESWLAAVEGCKLLACRGELTHERLHRLWSACPRVFRPDLVVAAAAVTDSAGWAENFLSGVKEDRVYEVVLAQRGRKSGSA